MMLTLVYKKEIWEKGTSLFITYHTGCKCRWLVLTQEFTSRTFNSLNESINKQVRNNDLIQHQIYKASFYMQPSSGQTNLSIWCDLELFSFKYVSPVLLWAGTRTHWTNKMTVITTYKLNRPSFFY
jgi:hypothetical protein